MKPSVRRRWQRRDRGTSIRHTPHDHSGSTTNSGHSNATINSTAISYSSSNTPLHHNNHPEASSSISSILHYKFPEEEEFFITPLAWSVPFELLISTTMELTASICTSNSISWLSISNTRSKAGVVGSLAGVKLTSLRVSKSKSKSWGEVRSSKKAVSGVRVLAAAMADTATKGLEQLPYKKDGYNFWKWRDHKVHYVVQGKGPPIVLIHGFGASAFHWRYNIPELAKTHTVYAMCLLGFGLSEKALIEYNADVWRDQVADFVREVVKKPAVLAGNSVGGFTVLSTAAAYPDLVSGVVLLNASGQFESASPEAKLGEETPEKDVVEMEESILSRLFISPVKNTVQKLTILFAFWQAKQPSRIRSVLENVYKDQTNVDDYLVDSIVQPTSDPNAGEVYYRLMTRILLQRSNQTINKLVSNLSCPMLLLWGDLDPWMGPSKCEQFKNLYPKATMVRLQAGHCPHDEVPEQVNIALLEFANSV